MKSSRYECVLLLVCMVVFMSCATFVNSDCGPLPPIPPWYSRDPSTASYPCQFNLELVCPYLEIDRYNKGYPFVNLQSIVYYDMFLLSNCGNDHIISEYWSKACSANTPEAWRTLGAEINHRMHQAKSLYNVSATLFGDTLASLIMSRLKDLKDLKVDVSEETKQLLIGGDEFIHLRRSYTPTKIIDGEDDYFDDDDYPPIKINEYGRYFDNDDETSYDNRNDSFPFKEKYRQCDSQTLFNIFTSHCGRIAGHESRTRQYHQTFKSMCFVGVEVDDFEDAVSQICRDYNYDPKPIPGFEEENWELW